MTKKYAVLWSGGADSTLALTMYASHSSIQTPIRALTIDGHRQLDKWQLKNEKRARETYLRWAKKQGYNIQHLAVKVDANIGAAIRDQTAIWLCHLSPYIQEDETVLLPYIRGDDFWHSKREFVAAFEALSVLMDLKREVHFPLEWNHKWEVVRDLKKWKVPDNCWWTCDSPKRNKPCGGVCNKCKALKSAREELIRKETMSKKGAVPGKRR